MFSEKWKLYIVYNYIQLVVSGVFVVLITVNFFINHEMDEAQKNSLYSGLVFFFLFLIVSVINVLLYKSLYPNKVIEGSAKVAYYLSALLGAVLNFFMIFVVVFIITSGFLTNASAPLISRIITAALFFLFCVNGVFVLVGQFKLKGILLKNYKKSIDSEIETIGSADINYE